MRSPWEPLLTTEWETLAERTSGHAKRRTTAPGGIREWDDVTQADIPASREADSRKGRSRWGIEPETIACPRPDAAAPAPPVFTATYESARLRTCRGSRSCRCPVRCDGGWRRRW